MTSKEALEELLYYATLDDSGFEPTMKRYTQYIEKDLEIVEILKKYLKFKNTTYSTIITLEIDAQENAIDYEIVEEWLEKED